MLSQIYRNKLVIGGAQLGNKYGITNNKKLSRQESIKILNFAKRKNINYVDLADSYKSQNILNVNQLNKFNIIFKFHLKKKEIEEKKIKKKIYDIYNKLNIKNFYCILLHDTMNYNNNELDIIFRSFYFFKKKNIVKNIGFSTYGTKFINKIISKYKIDVIQTTFNIFDSRILDEKIFSEIKKKKILLHIRSIFLQGVLLTRQRKVPEKLKNYKKYFSTWYKFLKLNKLKALNTCVNLALNQNFDKVIVGVNSISELKEILKVKKTKLKKKINLFNNKTNLINPYAW